MNFKDKIKDLKPYDLNCNVFDVYSYNGLSMQELLCQFFHKINECIKISNETIDLASWLVNEGLSIEVVNRLMLWLEDGTLEDLINVNLFNSLNTKIDNVNSQLEQIQNNHLSISVKDFGAKGDGITDDTEAFQNAINECYNGKSLFIPNGQYLISRTLNIKNAGFTMFGANSRDSKIIVAKNFGNGIEFSPIIKIAMDNKKDAIDKVNIHDLGFDAVNDTVNARGIQFEFLIYSSSFRNLNFDYFTGSCLYSSGTYSDRSEMITFEQIKMNSLTKALVEPQVNLTNVNESVFYNCRFFGKQAKTDTQTNYPLIYLHSCQGINIDSNCFFYIESAPAIKSYCGDGSNTQGLFIRNNTFEGCNYETTIDVSSKSGDIGKAGEKVIIGSNRVSSSVYKVVLNNIRASFIEDMFINVKMVNLCDGITIFTNSTYGITVEEENTSSYSRNTIIDFGGTYNTPSLNLPNVTSKSHVKLISAQNPYIELKPKTTTGATIKIESEVLYSDFSNAKLNIKFDNETSFTVTRFGCPVKRVETLPTPNGNYRGILYMLVNNSTNTDKLYVCCKQNNVDVWKEITLT